MKAKYIGPAAALAAALVLSACGGKASFEVAGTIINPNGTLQQLKNSGLVLQNGSDTVTVPAGASEWRFANRISYGTLYDVTVRTNPAHMTCLANGGKGSAGHTVAISVPIVCTQNAFRITGAVNNLTLDGLTIINGSSSSVYAVPKGSTVFTFPDSIPVGTPYGLTIATQPTKDATTGATLTCTLTNATGIMGDQDRTDAVLSCQ